MLTSLAYAALAAGSVVNAAAIPSTFTLEFSQNNVLVKRTGMTAELENVDNTFGVNAYIGKDRKEMKFAISPDLAGTFVIGSGNVWCDNNCSQTYNPEEFSTSIYREKLEGNVLQNVTMGDEYIFEDAQVVLEDFFIGLPDVKHELKRVQHAPFLVSNKTDIPTNYFGIGFLQPFAKQQYHINLAELLYKNDVTHGTAYSVQIDDTADFSGKILFGGIDRMQIEGGLARFGLRNATDHTSQFIEPYVDIEQVTVLRQGENITAVPESTLVYVSPWKQYVEIPAPNMGTLAGALGFPSVESDNGKYYVACDENNDAVVGFKFPHFQADVVMSELKSARTHSSNNTDMCELLIHPTDSQYVTIGRPAFKSLYVVYNFENDELAIARREPAPEAPEIIRVDKSIPYTSGASSVSVAYATALICLVAFLF